MWAWAWVSAVFAVSMLIQHSTRVMLTSTGHTTLPLACHRLGHATTEGSREDLEERWHGATRARDIARASGRIYGARFVGFRCTLHSFLNITTPPHPCIGWMAGGAYVKGLRLRYHAVPTRRRPPPDH